MPSKNKVFAKKKDYSKYPFMNLSLEDMPGEEWVSIPGFDDCFYVSQYGRIWALRRPIYAIDGHFYYVRERIRKQNLVKYYNAYTKDYREQLAVHIRYERKNYTLAVNRLVYEAFVGPIGKKMRVVHKDGDNCNNHYKNLVLMDGTLLYRHNLQLERWPRTGKLKKKGKRLIWAESNAPRPVIKYSLDGKKLAEYESVRAAADDNNATRGGIRAVLKKRSRQYNGFVYRYKGDKYNGEYADYSRGKKVTQYSLGGRKISVFPSASNASINTGIDGDMISKCALHKTKYAGGYVWRYNGDTYKSEYKKKKNIAKPIMQYSLAGKIIARFQSLNQAAKETGFTVSTIKSCVNKETKVSHGYVWRFEDDKYNGEYKHYHRGKPVTQFSLKGGKIKTYPSIEEAARASGLTPDNIQKNVKGENKTAGGFIWRYASAAEIKKLPVFKGVGHTKNSPTAKPVVKYSVDGKKIATYESLSQAANENKVSISGITAALDMEGRTSGGFVWRTKGNRYHGNIVKNPPANRAKTVTQYDFMGKRIAQYKSTKEAERKTGISGSAISAVAAGRLNTTGGFIWLYNETASRIDAKKYLAVRGKKVVKYTLEGERLKEYSSIVQAAHAEQLPPAGISKTINGRQISSGGFLWREE